jgi:hypothetical protein
MRQPEHRDRRLRSLAGLLLAACAPGPGAAAHPIHSHTTPVASPIELGLERALPIDISDDFQPSGLALREGRLLTVSDKHDDGVFEIVPGDSSARLLPFVRFAAPPDEPLPLDFEGLAVDRDGALLLASEMRFRVLRVEVSGSAQWITPHLETVGHRIGLFQKDNACLEGVARLPNGRLLVAAEREPRGLIELGDAPDVSRSFAWAMPDSLYPVPKGRKPDFADLTVADGQVYALERNSHLVVRLARTDEGWEEREAWSYAAAENDPRFIYREATYGLAEGIAIDRDHVFLVTDNNRLGRAADPGDRRPLLFILARPRTQ